MYFSTSFVASALVGLSLATTQSGGGIAASETLSSAPAAMATAASAAGAAGTVNTHVIQVGGPNGTTVFMPNNVKAMPGDLVQFQFNQKNHSVVQSTFDQPCIPIQNVMANKTDAFFSGFMPNNRTFGTASTAGLLTYTIRVMDTKPIWFYCSQAKHCQNGMVGAINAAESGNKTVAAFAQLAAAATENLSPGQAAGAGAAGGSPSASGGAGDGAAATATGGAGAGAGASATASSADTPAQQTTNAAPGRFASASRDSLLGLGLAGFAAFVAL